MLSALSETSPMKLRKHWVLQTKFAEKTIKMKSICLFALYFLAFSQQSCPQEKRNGLRICLTAWRRSIQTKRVVNCVEDEMS